MDLNNIHEQIIFRKWAIEEERRKPTRIRIFDGNWNLYQEIQGEYSHRFKFLKNDAGDAEVKLPLDHPVSLDMMNPLDWPTKSMYLVFDKDGARWSGRIELARSSKTATGDQYFEITAVHDYKKLKELLVWSNPFLPDLVQFPKAWFLFGPAKWIIGVTLLANLHRMYNSSWQLPDDPLDVGQWFDLDMSGWWQAVKFQALHEDATPVQLISSRFKYFHDCAHPILEATQLVIESRRYLPGDENPLPGTGIQHGCLVHEVVDKSGWRTGTAFTHIGQTVSNIISGFVRGTRVLTEDGLVSGYNVIDIKSPEIYNEPGWMGTAPSAPWVVLYDNEYTSLESSDYEYTPPGASQFTTGGSSMTGVNETIKASIIGIGGFLGSFFGQSQVGAVAEAILEPLYSDVFMAFQTKKLHDRIREQGGDRPLEQWVDGSDNAHSVGSTVNLLLAIAETEESYACKIKMNDGQPYYVGSHGKGDFFIGDRVGVHTQGMPEGQLFVNQVESLEYSASESDEGWDIEVGPINFTSGLRAVAKSLETLKEAAQQQGVW